MKILLKLTLVIQIVAIAGFLWSVWQSNQVMGKDGIGNLELWSQYNNQAGIAIFVAVLFWVVSIIAAVTSKCFRTPQAQITIGIPPLAAIFGWLSLWFI